MQRAQALGVIEELFSILSEMLPAGLRDDYVMKNPTMIWGITAEYLFRPLRQRQGNVHYSDEDIRANLDPAAVAEIARRMEFVALELATFVPLIDIVSGGAEWDRRRVFRTLGDQ